MLKYRLPPVVVLEIARALVDDRIRRGERQGIHCELEVVDSLKNE